jgi:alkylated DNA nucleotide flippase Atl1
MFLTFCHQSNCFMPAAIKPKTKGRATWTEKLEKEQQIKIVEVPAKMKATCGEGTMLIASPKIILEVVKQIPKGKITSVNKIREKLAKAYGTDTTCPITTGIFLWIVANAMDEAKTKGAKKIDPYWRVLKEGGKLNDKFPGGIKAHAKQLEAEGFMIVWNKTKTTASVFDYERKLFTF